MNVKTASKNTYSDDIGHQDTRNYRAKNSEKFARTLNME